ncbi:hypothetical protein PBI_SCTP2_96 [Salicola phage SCTP-2]|nr:hypothetical protein PBI_SCTP2_96 [Salicola phage SCTP-2]
MKERFLFVFDIDHTLINWFDGYELDDNGNFEYVQEGDERINAHGMLKRLNKLHNVDIALFTTGKTSYAHSIKEQFFHDIHFEFVLGREYVTYYNEQKVKDIRFFCDHKYKLVTENKSYNINNVILLDDKPRNGQLFPNNFIKIRDYQWYEYNEIFDNELEKIEKKLLRMIDKALKHDITLINNKNGVKDD